MQGPQSECIILDPYSSLCGWAGQEIMELFYTPCSGAINQGQEAGGRRQGAGGEEGEGVGNIKREDNEQQKR